MVHWYESQTKRFVGSPGGGHPATWTSHHAHGAKEARGLGISAGSQVRRAASIDDREGVVCLESFGPTDDHGVQLRGENIAIMTLGALAGVGVFATTDSIAFTGARGRSTLVGPQGQSTSGSAAFPDRCKRSSR